MTSGSGDTAGLTAGEDVLMRCSFLRDKAFESVEFDADGDGAGMLGRMCDSL
jgi:hypothetical protein